MSVEVRREISNRIFEEHIINLLQKTDNVEVLKRYI